MCPRFLAIPALATLTAFWSATLLTATAQIVPDHTLGSESSVVTPNVTIRGINSDRIDGGAVRGGNLFHSFEEFNVEEGRGSYFSNPDHIINILTRVTGGNISEILGTLGVLGNANLFLMNPNGIVFGPNSRLDVGGSFFATTADGILFENGLEFAASHPEAPPLLTINMPLGLNIRSNPGTIVNQSIAVDPQNRTVGLQVPNQRTLALIGGDLVLEGGILTTKQGHIELGSVGENSFVKFITIPSSDYRLSYDNISDFRDILLTQEAEVETSGDGGGAIRIQGRTVRLSEESKLTADTIGDQNGEGIFIQANRLIIEDGSQVSASATEESTGKSGGIEVNALESIEILGTSPPGSGGNGNSGGGEGSGGNQGNGNGSGGDQGNNNGNNGDSDGQLKPSKLSSDARGFNQAGDLMINTQTLTLTDGAKISASTIEADGGGNIVINANDFVQIIGTSSDGRRSSGISVQTRGNGRAGDITINTGQLILREGAEVSASTFGNGRSGMVNVNTTESIELTGVSSTGELPSRIIAETGEARETIDGGVVVGTGTGGDLNITTPQLLVQGGARISVSTSSQGNAGDLRIQANQTQLRGTSGNSLSSGLFAFVESGGTGNGGILSLNTQRLEVTDGAKISAATFGNGNGGNLIIQATEIELIGTSSNGNFPSAIAVSVQLGAEGNGGNLNIDTQDLTIRDGAIITAETLGNGDGGTLIVTSEDIEIIGESADGRFPSALLASVGEQATGNEGTLTINTQRLIVTDGGEIVTGTAGNGNGGDLTINATDVEISGTSADGQVKSGLFANAESTAIGQAGTLTVNANRVTVRDGATIDVRSEGSEAAGNLEINAQSILVDNQASLNAETTAGQGNIILNTNDLRLRRNSNMTTNATGEATGGNIEVNTNLLVAIEDSDISANAQQAFGGQVIINANAIFGTEFRTQATAASDITATSQLGAEFSGMVELNTEFDTSSGLVDLPQTVVDPAALIAQDPCKQRGNSEFMITGRGGIAPNPIEDLPTTQGLAELELIEPVTPQVHRSSQRPQQRTRKRENNRDNHPVDSRTIVPARGWIRTDDGKVMLVSYDPTKTEVQRQPNTLDICQSSR